jgi:hypothetical protein
MVGASCVLLSCGASTDNQAQASIPVCGEYTISLPTVVAFLNYGAVEADDPDFPDVLADFQLSVERLRQRLDGSVIRVHECYQASFGIAVPGKSIEQFAVGSTGVGYYLVAPAMMARVEHGVQTDEDLIAVMKEHFGIAVVNRALERSE